jgi:hypothetical protein
VAGGFALCVALVPGTALADDEPTTPAPLEDVTGVLEEGAPGGDLSGEDPAAGAEEGEEQSPLEETPEEPPPFEIPPELVEAFETLAAGAGVSEECVTGVTEALEQIGNGIAGLPTELQALVTELTDAVQQSITDQNPAAFQKFLEDHGLALTPPEGGSGEPPALPPPPVGEDIATGFEQLIEVLQSDACKPAPPTPPAPPANNPPSNPPASYQPPQAPVAPAPQAPIQPAVYPGYAPTGAEEVDGPSPAAIALALAFLAGSLAWSERRWRAARSD